MKAILWKELRENLTWAALAMLGFGLALAYAWSTADKGVYDWQSSESLCSGHILQATTLGSAAIAILFGLLQILTETRRDQWAFLIHRPVPRHTIFLGKVVAGVTLYLLATGTPFLVAVLWASRPEHLAAPFDWRMALPGVADILNGIAFYFGALLTGLRQARWYASRSLGLATAVGCAFLATNAPEFYHAVWITSLFGLVLFVAAWASFLTTGTYASQPVAGKVCLAMTLAIGVFVIGMVAMMVSSTLLSERRLYTYADYRVDLQGRVLKVVSEGNWLRSITDLEGNTLPLPTATDRFGGGMFLQAYPLRDLGYGNESSPYRQVARYYLPVDARGEIAWFYVWDQNRIPGYSRKEKTLVGYLGPDGFTPASNKDSARFEEDPVNVYGRIYKQLVRFRHSLYRIEPDLKHVTLLARAAQAQTFHGACEVSPTYGAPEDARVIVAVTDSQIEVLKPDGELMFATPLRHDLSSYSGIQVAMLPKGERFFFWYSPSWKIEREQRATMPIFITEVAADSVLLKDHELPALNIGPDTSNWTEFAMATLVPPSFYAGFLGYLTVRVELGNANATGEWRSIRRELAKHWWLGVMICLSSLAAAAIAYRVARVYAFEAKARVVWPISVFLLGPAGLLMFAAVQEWPAREPCSSCGKKRVVDRDRCEHCCAEFALPARDGTEIFES